MTPTTEDSSAKTERVSAHTVSVPVAARMLGISRGFGFELAKRGELPGAIRLGTRIVVSRRQLEQVLNGESDVGR